MFTESSDPIVDLGIGPKITLSLTKDFLKKKLSTDKVWAQKALLKIFEAQTEDEVYFETTKEYNKVGFTGVDAEILTSFAKQLKNRGFLSPKQMTILFKKMPKYWHQIANISNKEKLDRLIHTNLI